MPTRSLHVVLLLCLIAVTSSVLLVEEATAQRRSGSSRGSFDVGMILKTIDTNKNGIMEPSEMAGRTKEFVRRAGLDPNRAHAISTITQKLNEKKNAKDTKAKTTNGSGTVERNVPGFGIDREAPFVPDFSPSGEERMSLAAMKRKFSASVMSQVERTFTRYDKDKNGLIDGTEQTRTRWTNPSASESDTNSDGSLSMLEMAYRYKNREDEALNKGGKPRTSSVNRSSRSPKSAQEATEKYKYVSGRSSRSSSTKSSRTSRSTRSGRGNPIRSESSSARLAKSGFSSGNDAYRRYADGLIKNYDKDGDKRLSKEEVKEMRRPLKNADTNKDGYIDKNEMVASVTRRSGGDSKADTSKEAKSSSKSRSKSKVLDSKRRSASKAYNSGDSIFGGKDINSDRQLQMYEFASDWDDKTVDEFKTKDLNDDGVITEEEWKNGE